VRLSGISRDIRHITGNSALMMSIKDKEVGHLDWLTKAEMGLIDTNTKKLDVQTDPHRCSFGNWYYGFERISFYAS
jgi:methyl-accepting chemotaxis protein